LKNVAPRETFGHIWTQGGALVVPNFEPHGGLPPETCGRTTSEPEVDVPMADDTKINGDKAQGSSIHRNLLAGGEKTEILPAMRDWHYVTV
jgi:hypothetical protein